MKQIIFALLMALVSLSVADTQPGPHMHWNWDGLDANGNPESLAGFNIHWSTQPGACTAAGACSDTVHFVPDPTARSVAIGQFATASGEYFCVVKAIDIEGNESAASNEAHFFINAGVVVLAAPPAAPYNLTVSP
ncbi:MAG TPA: hypothetical protein ENK00_01470 [Chromatiales bacterium]|nr:hypothetical protein [Chromatiales bacterium]